MIDMDTAADRDFDEDDDDEDLREDPDEDDDEDEEELEGDDEEELPKPILKTTGIKPKSPKKWTKKIQPNYVTQSGASMADYYQAVGYHYLANPALTFSTARNSMDRLRNLVRSNDSAARQVGYTSLYREHERQVAVTLKQTNLEAYGTLKGKIETETPIPLFYVPKNQSDLDKILEYMTSSDGLPALNKQGNYLIDNREEGVIDFLPMWAIFNPIARGSGKVQMLPNYDVDVQYHAATESYHIFIDGKHQLPTIKPAYKVKELIRQVANQYMAYIPPRVQVQVILYNVEVPTIVEKKIDTQVGPAVRFDIISPLSGDRLGDIWLIDVPDRPTWDQLTTQKQYSKQEFAASLAKNLGDTISAQVDVVTKNHTILSRKLVDVSQQLGQLKFTLGLIQKGAQQELTDKFLQMQVLPGVEDVTFFEHFIEVKTNDLYFEHANKSRLFMGQFLIQFYPIQRRLEAVNLKSFSGLSGHPHAWSDGEMCADSYVTMLDSAFKALDYLSVIAITIDLLSTMTPTDSIAWGRWVEREWAIQRGKPYVRSEVIKILKPTKD